MIVPDISLYNRLQGEVWRPQCRVDTQFFSIECQQWTVYKQACTQNKEIMRFPENY